ncbi:hypothetical protein C8J55DRAFT_486096 [Lentinula edodes]|uniref:Uncharacterized protein n=1 Tax=Lentinula lateritia TaxID=40482 RepID=A0A9W9AWW2_9AGAR|nr:hypothetical protein C8J55DRAFT_486096 [Lentinula edodes]
MPRKRNRYSTPTEDSDESDNASERVLQADNYTLRTSLAQVVHERDLAIGQALQANTDLASRLTVAEVQLQAKSALLIDMESRIGLMPGHYAYEQRNELVQTIEAFKSLQQKNARNDKLFEPAKDIPSSSHLDEASESQDRKANKSEKMQAPRTTDAGKSLNHTHFGKSLEPNQPQTETRLGHSEARHFLLEDDKQDYRHQIDQLNTEKHLLQNQLAEIKLMLEQSTSQMDMLKERLQGLNLVKSELKTSHQKYEQKELLIEERYQEMFKREVNENMSKLANALQKVEDLEGQKRSMQSDMSTLQPQLEQSLRDARNSLQISRSKNDALQINLDNALVRLGLSLKQTCRFKAKMEIFKTQFKRAINREAQLKESLQEQSELDDTKNCKAQLEQLLEGTYKPRIEMLEEHAQDLKEELKNSSRKYQEELSTGREKQIQLVRDLDEHRGKLEASHRHLALLQAEKEALELDMSTVQTQIDQSHIVEAQSKRLPQAPTECPELIAQNKELLSLQQRCFQLERSELEATSKYETQNNLLQMVQTELSNSREEMKCLEVRTLLFNYFSFEAITTKEFRDSLEGELQSREKEVRALKMAWLTAQSNPQQVEMPSERGYMASANLQGTPNADSTDGEGHILSEGEPEIVGTREIKVEVKGLNHHNESLRQTIPPSPTNSKVASVGVDPLQRPSVLRSIDSSLSNDNTATAFTELNETRHGPVAQRLTTARKYEISLPPSSVNCIEISLLPWTNIFLSVRRLGIEEDPVVLSSIFYTTSREPQRFLTGMAKWKIKKSTLKDLIEEETRNIAAAPSPIPTSSSTVPSLDSNATPAEVNRREFVSSDRDLNDPGDVAGALALKALKSADRLRDVIVNARNGFQELTSTSN